MNEKDRNYGHNQKENLEKSAWNFEKIFWIIRHVS